MQPHNTLNLKGTLVEIKPRVLSGSVETIAGRITSQPLLVVSQSGDWVSNLTPDLDMETTSITDTLIEMKPQNDKMIDLSQGTRTAIPSNIMGSAEDYVLQGPLGGTSKTAIFDVHSDFSVDSGSGMFPFLHTGDLASPHISSKEVGVSPQKPTPSMLHESTVDCGLSSEWHQLPINHEEFGLINSIFPTERPLSPSDFIMKHPAQSDQPEGFELPEHVCDEISKILAESNEDIPVDCVQQLDLNLFSHHEEPDALDSILQDCGILEEEVHLHEERLQQENKEESHLHEESLLEKTEESHLHQKEESHLHRKGYVQNGKVHTAGVEQTRNVNDTIGPIRNRHVRRARRKPARYREMKELDDPATTGELQESVTPSSNAVKSVSLSNEEKYLKNRQQNNLASKRCREKRKKNLENLSVELDVLEDRNKVLQDKVAQLTVLRDNFRDFVNKHLFQRLAQR